MVAVVMATFNTCRYCSMAELCFMRGKPFSRSHFSPVKSVSMMQPIQRLSTCHCFANQQPQQNSFFNLLRKQDRQFCLNFLKNVLPLNTSSQLRKIYTSSSLCNGQGGQESDNSDKDKNRSGGDRPGFTYLVGAAWVALTVYLYTRMTQRTDLTENADISWNEFYHDMLAKGEVNSITIFPEMEAALIDLMEGAIVKDHRVHRLQYNLKIPDPMNFENKIRKAEHDLNLKPGQSIRIQYHWQSDWSRVVRLLVISGALFLLFRAVASRIRLPNITDMFGSVMKANFMRVDVASKHGQGIRFKDVAGLKEAKMEIIEFVDYLTNPQRFQDLGAKIPHGALLLGPPGCGKTLLACAVATEAKVPFLAMAGSEFVEMLGGLGAARVRDLFKEARKKAPCIVYIDEIDSIGRKRIGSGGASNQEEEQTLNQLLVELDGMGTQAGVIALASTNRADVLDKALLRPGRFDRQIMIDLPTLLERQEIFDLYLSKLKLLRPPHCYSARLAQLTPGMSGADISNICNEAAIHAVREGKGEIHAPDFQYATERVIAGVEKKTRLLAPTERKVVAYHESGHALVGWLLPHTDALLRISIVPRTNSTLCFAQYLPSDQKLYSSDELFERMCMALGGRAAESVIFNHVSTGAQDDLQKVTKMAYDQIRSYGMNERIGVVAFSSPAEGLSSEFMIKPYSRRLQATIDKEAQILVSRVFQHTVNILQINKDKLHKLAKTLLEKESLSCDEVEALIGPPPHGKKNVIEPHGWEGIMPDVDSGLPS